LARPELTFLDLLHELDAARRDRRMIKSLEAQHRPNALLNPAVILLNLCY
jgi:hypothetical protein